MMACAMPLGAPLMRCSAPPAMAMNIRRCAAPSGSAWGSAGFFTKMKKKPSGGPAKMSVGNDSPECLDISFHSKKSCSPKQPPRDPLLQLVSLQKASGCWELDPALAAALGKTSEEVDNTKPASVNQEVWATILALIWLRGFKMDAQEEWELLAMKAASWLRAQNAPCVTECVEAGNALLGCNVQKDALGF